MITIEKDNPCITERGQGICAIRRNDVKGVAAFEAPVFLQGGFIGSIAGTIGAFSYLANGYIIKGLEGMGRFCSVAPGLNAGYGSHNYNLLSTHPMFEGIDLDWEGQYTENFKGGGSFWLEKVRHISDEMLKEKRKPASIGNDVWIGKDVFICSGVTVGNGAVIGAKAVVTKDVPPYAIVAGSPARIIKYRFSDPVIEKLEELQWWNYGPDILFELPLEKPRECCKEIERRIKENLVEKYIAEKFIIDGRTNEITHIKKDGTGIRLIPEG